MAKVGILGGTFDPPHFGHLLIANEVLDSLMLDEIWFMPNGKPPHKQIQSGATKEQRLTMLKLAIEGVKSFKIEPIELLRDGPSYTVDTIELLINRKEDDQFYFIIGADMVEYLPKWHRISDLVKMVTFVGVERPNYQLATPYPVEFVHVPEFAVSSSLIRDRFKNGGTTNYLLPDSVIQYIKENHLYGA